MSSNNNNQQGTTTQQKPCSVCPKCPKCDCEGKDNGIRKDNGTPSGVIGIFNFCLMLLIIYCTYRYIQLSRSTKEDDIQSLRDGIDIMCIVLYISCFYIIFGSYLIYANRWKF